VRRRKIALAAETETALHANGIRLFVARRPFASVDEVDRMPPVLEPKLLKDFSRRNAQRVVVLEG
jgi:hypothetical protein